MPFDKSPMRNLFSLAIVLLVLSGCSGEADTDASTGSNAEVGGERKSPAEKTRDRDAVKTAFKSRPVPVSIDDVVLGAIDATYATTATLSAVEEALVVARTQGIVETIFVEEGMVVEKGTPLAQLDTRRLALDMARTETNLESLKRALNRADQLYASKMISPDAFDQARFNYEREAAVLALLAHDLSEATIRAPINGVITVRHIKLGNTLQPNSQAFEMKRSDVIEAILNVPEQELLKLKPDQPASIRVDALRGWVVDGQVLRIAPEVNAATGTFRVTVTMLNPDGQLKPGMFARVDILYDRYSDALLVSREAVITQRNEKSVFVLSGETVKRQLIETGYTQGDRVEVKAGLSLGDQVVVRGQSTLKDGGLVRVVQ